MAWRNVALLPDLKETVRRLVESVNLLGNGRSNAVGTLTLRASQTTTEVMDKRVGLDSVIMLMPTTANAAAALSTTYVSARSQGSFELTHASNGQTDKTFGYAIKG
jgi:hypothetical protein